MDENKIQNKVGLLVNPKLGEIIYVPITNVLIKPEMKVSDLVDLTFTLNERVTKLEKLVASLQKINEKQVETIKAMTKEYRAEISNLKQAITNLGGIL